MSETPESRALRKLVEVGGKMRDTQKLYYKTRDTTVLRLSKMLEAEFDRLIDRHRQPQLFELDDREPQRPRPGDQGDA